MRNQLVVTAAEQHTPTQHELGLLWHGSGSGFGSDSGFYKEELY